LILKPLDYAKRTSNCFPLTIELLFEDDILKELGNWDEEPIPGTTSKISKFKGEKKKFWEKLFRLDKQHFQHFKPLFDKINELFNPPNNTHEGYSKP
jgi:hypothetical protein